MRVLTFVKLSEYEVTDVSHCSIVYSVGALSLGDDFDVYILHVGP